MKDERGGKTITKCETTAPKTYGYRVHKVDHAIKDSKFIRGKGVKKPASKDLTFNEFDKCLHNVTNKPIAKKQISFRSYNYQSCFVASNKIGICNPNENDKESQDTDGITTCIHG